MSDQLRRLEDLPLEERVVILREIKEYLLQLIYDEVLPTMDPEKKIEALKTLDRVERIGPESTPANDDADMLTEVMREAEAILL